MSSLLPKAGSIDVAALRAEIAAMSIEDKVQALTACLSHTRDNFFRMALLVKSLEDDGKDLSHLKGLRNILEALRLIACERLHPEILVRYGSNRKLLALFGSLPYAEQERIVSGGRYRMLSYAPDGSLSHRSVTVEEMVADQVDQVFARGTVRDEAEQRSWLDAKRVRESSTNVPERVGQFTNIDPELGTAVIGRHTVTKVEVRALLRAWRK